MNFKALPALLKQTGKAWSADNASRMAAALAYYTIFSIAPLLIIAIAIAGYIFGEQAVTGQLFYQISGFVGAQAAGIVQEMVKSAEQSQSGVITSVLGVVALVWAASNLFNQFQQALNTIWHVDAAHTKGVLAFLWQRFVAIAMVIGMGVLMVASLVAITVISALGHVLEEVMPLVVEALPLTDIVASLLLMTLVCMVMFRVLPNTPIAWRDVLGGALLTALLFTFGRYLIGLYLANASYASSFGAAGSLVVLLVWVYYSSQILLFGAEFTKVYAHTYGSRRARETPKTSALATVVAATGEPAWPSLIAAANRPPAREPASPLWVLTATLAFLTGLVAGARRR